MSSSIKFNVKKSALVKIFTALIVLYPILFRYRSFINFEGVTLADTFLLIIIPFLIFEQLKFGKLSCSSICWPFVLYGLHIFVDLLFKNAFIQTENIFDLNMTTLRYLLYLFALAFFSKHFFNFEIGIKLIKYSTLVASVYLIIQDVSYKYFGIFIPGVISKFMMPNANIDRIQLRVLDGLDIRHVAFFAEPSHFCIYVLLYLIIALYHANMNINKYIIPIIISLSILMSRSSTGIITAAFVWSISLLRNMFKRGNFNKKITFVTVCITLVPLILLVIVNSSSFEIFLSRTISSNGGMGSATINRFGAINIGNFFDGLSLYEIFFGTGIIDLDSYYPGLVSIVYRLGVFGFAIFFTVVTSINSKIKGIQKGILLIFIFLNIGTEIIWGCWIILYFSFVIAFHTRAEL